MAGKKDQVVVAVIGDLTRGQAAQIAKEITRAKDRCAPNARGTIAKGIGERVGRLLQKGNQHLTG